jgi:hypothetical protein
MWPVAAWDRFGWASSTARVFAFGLTSLMR